ncbi:hypothetical protein WME75_32230 [Sorangium sp. So ce1014]|uniref:hypothetical protein n=1 Tax=Sorangium sp. So ce1014 TaxID=3133326 RepID=UPI003F647780
MTSRRYCSSSTMVARMPGLISGVAAAVATTSAVQRWKWARSAGSRPRSSAMAAAGMGIASSA